TLEKDVPIHIEGVVAGDYTVSASAEGYLGFLETRKVGSGNWTHDFRIQLDSDGTTPPDTTKPTPTTPKKVVSWDASPENATLKFDRTLYSLHESYVEVDSGSVHSLKVVAENYFDYDSTFVVNQNMYFNINLVKKPDPKPCAQGFRVIPQDTLGSYIENCTIYLDRGNGWELWSEVDSTRETGNYSVKVTHENYQETTFSFTVYECTMTDVPITLRVENPTPPECWKTKSDGDWLYFSVNVRQLGWQKIVFDASVCSLGEVFFADMKNVGEWYRYWLNNLPCDDYGRFTLVNENDHWFDKDSDCHPEMVSGVAFDTDPNFQNWFRFDWNGRQDPTPPPTKGTFKLNVLTVDATVKLNNDYWPLNGEWQLDPGEYRLVVSKTGYNTHDETFNLNADETVERIITLAEEEPTEPYLIVSQVDSIISFNGTEAPKIKYVKVWVPVEEQGDGNWWTAEWLQVDNKKVNVAGMKKRYIMTLYIEQNDNSNWHGSWGRVEAISPVEKFYYTSDGTWNLKFQPEM
ncbi:PEGA domain-containing protein, partial [Patescibacteria group bacterium]|nr:PEGA domain-containing protein [Patescibacteria group bacterium]